MENEKLTIYNAFNQPVGEAERSEVHKNGLWHRSVNYLILDKEKRTLVFQDSQTLDQFDKDKFFIKMNGGHVQGDDMENEMARELHEELGLEISKAEGTHFLGVYQISFEPTKDFINREFMYFYLVSFSNVLQNIGMDETPESGEEHDPEYVVGKNQNDEYVVKKNNGYIHKNID
jgi:isopentenyldiphosphate isomerase